MRDMMATHERLDPGTDGAREAVSRAAAAAFEALPALLLAAALLAPALAAFAARTAVPADLDRKAIEARTGLSLATGRSIAEQGDEALKRIREESLEALRENLALPKLS